MKVSVQIRHEIRRNQNIIRACYVHLFYIEQCHYKDSTFFGSYIAMHNDSIGACLHIKMSKNDLKLQRDFLCEDLVPVCRDEDRVLACGGSAAILCVERPAVPPLPNGRVALHKARLCVKVCEARVGDQADVPTVNVMPSSMGSRVSRSSVGTWQMVGGSWKPWPMPWPASCETVLYPVSLEISLRIVSRGQRK